MFVNIFELIIIYEKGIPVQTSSIYIIATDY